MSREAQPSKFGFVIEHVRGAGYRTWQRRTTQFVLVRALVAGLACWASIATAQSFSLATPSTGPARSIQSAGLERAIANYEALARGEKRLADLSLIEQEELRELRALLRAARPRTRDSRDACIARETAARGGVLTMLEERVVDLICSQHGD